MRVLELHLEGFGRLVNRRLQFAPGLNLVLGPNEVGKSTMQQALVALLFGFCGEGPVSPAAQALLTALKPWDDTTFYAGSLTYALDNGQAFRVTRRFLPRPETLLQTHPEGVDVAGRFRRASEGRLFFADEQLGLSREVFETLCVVHQGRLQPLAAPSAVKGALSRILARAPTDVATGQAMNRLQKALGRVAVPDGRAGPLAQALARLSELKDERQQVLRARAALASRAAALKEASQRVEVLALQRDQLRLLQTKAARGSERARLAVVDEAAQELARCEGEVARWGAWASFPAQSRDQVLRLVAQRGHLQRECAASEERARQAQKTLHDLQAQQAALEQRLAASDDTLVATTDEFVNIQQLAAEWTSAREDETLAHEQWETANTALETLAQRLSSEGKPLEMALPLGIAGLAAVQKRLQQARERLAQAKGAAAEVSSRWAQLGIEESQFREAAAAASEAGSARSGADGRRGTALLSRVRGRLGRGVQRADETPLYAQAQELHAELVRCREEMAAAQQALSDTEAATLWQLGDLLGGTLNDSAFTRLSERLAAHLREAATLEQKRISVATLRSELEQARRRREKAEKAVADALARLDYDTKDVRKALSAYMRRHERKGRATSNEEDERQRARLQAGAELDILRFRSEALQQELQHQRERQATLAEVEAQILDALGRAGIDPPNGNLDQGLAALDEAYENHRRWEKAQAALDTATRCYRALLGSQITTSSETDRLLQFDTKLSALQAKRPDWATVEPDRPPQAYATLLQEVEQQLAPAQKERDELQAALQEASNGLRHLAELDEEIAAAEATVVRLEHLRDALQRAQDELAAASEEHRKQFIPRLEFLLSDALHTVTGGHHSKAVIDEQTLEVTVHVPGRDEPSPVDLLSGSTRDLTHFLLRVCIVRLVSECGEAPPILLDEPLSHCDSTRQQRAFNCLLQLAERNQVFFFTRDEHLRAYFEKRAASPTHKVFVLG
jgi:DNA repair exonuclease SbcCD ATPase subunit